MNPYDNPIYNYQQQTPGPPQPQWQAPPRRGWGDPRLQQQQPPTQPPQPPQPQSPISPYHSFGPSNTFGPPLPPPPPIPPSTLQHDTSAWGVRYNQGLTGQQYEPKPPLPPRPDSAAGRLSPQPDPTLNYSQQPPISSGHHPHSHQYTASWSDPYNAKPPPQQAGYEPPPPPPPPRPAEYQTQAQAQALPGHNRINTPHQEYSHHAPTHHYDPQAQNQWAPQPASSGPGYYSGQPAVPQATAHTDAPLVSPIEATSSYWGPQHSSASGNYLASQKQDTQQPTTNAFGFGGPSDWEHYASSPPNETPTSPAMQPQDHYNQGPVVTSQPPVSAPTAPVVPTAKPTQIDVGRPPSPVEIGAASPVTPMKKSNIPPPTGTSFQQPSTHIEERPSSSSGRLPSNGSTRSDSVAENGTIDSVIQAWNAPLQPRPQQVTNDRPGSRDSAPQNLNETTPTVKVVDPYADLEPEFKASLKRYAAMLAKESAAGSDEEKFDIFQSFVKKELRLRSLLYGIELKNEPKEVRKAASLADIHAALPADVKPADVSKAIDTLRRQGSISGLQPLQAQKPASITPSAPPPPAPTPVVQATKAERQPPQQTAATSILAQPPVQRATSPASQPPVPPINTKTLVEERPKSKDESFVMVGTGGDEEGEYSPGGRPRVTKKPVDDEGEYSPGGRPRVNKQSKPATALNTSEVARSQEQSFFPTRPDGSLSPSINAPMVIDDYRTPGPAISPGVNAPILVLPEMAPPSSGSRPTTTNKPSKPIKFEPPRPAYTPFRYNAAAQDEKPKTLQPADKAYSSLRHSAIDSGRLMAADNLIAPARPASAGGRREHEEAFIGLIRKQSMAIRHKTPGPNSVPNIIRPGTAAPDLRGPPPMAMRVGTPANSQTPGELLKRAVTGLRSVLPAEAPPATPIDGPEHPKLKIARMKADAVRDDFGFIHATVVEWDRTNREVRKQQEAERHARQQESEAHIDGLFNDNEIGYADIGDLEADFKLAEAERRYRENQEELESFTAQVFNKVTDTLQKEIAELTTAYTLAIDLLDLGSEAISQHFNKIGRLPNEPAKMSEVMSCVLLLFNKMEVRYQKLAEAHVERERRRKHLELTVLYTNGDTAGVKRLESEFATAEKMQVLHEARARDNRANKLMDSFDRATVRGLGDNQTFVDDLLVKVQDLKKAVGNADASAREKFFDKDGVKDTLSLAQESINAIITDSRRLLALSNEADILLNESDYGVSVAEARVANADQSTYSSLEAEKRKEDTKLIEEVNARVNSVIKGPNEVLALVKEVSADAGEDPDHKERMKKALEAAKQRNTSIDLG